MSRRVLLGFLVSFAAVSTITAADPPKAGKTNRLAKEASPYLRQHAHNPVDWYPWGKEALDKAKKENKLIFLSVGYSACHWCHVMERESFANQAIAAILNEHFVCIKVDREERPDVDEVYMLALQTIGEGSGWPMSVFLTPTGKPIFGGTYWPPEDREVDGEKQTGFKSILKRVIDLNKEKGKELLAQADKVAELTAEAAKRGNRLGGLIPMNKELIVESRAAFQFDPEYGGLGSKSRDFRGPKFPKAPALLFLVEQARQPNTDSIRQGLALTLKSMARGGIYDQLGGGFHRYTTERTWTVPHFEKMLYDNAQLVELYAEAYRDQPEDGYRRVIESTLSFVEREMTSPEGGFYSALDADSDGHEGASYVWTREELTKLLGTNPAGKLWRQHFDVEKPNFENNTFILKIKTPLEDLAKSENSSVESIEAKLKPINETLLKVRNERTRPFLDEKMLTGWNGQMIAAYARAGQVLKRPDYTKRAVDSMEALLKKVTGPDGRLMRLVSQKPGEKSPQAMGAAYLEDYAYVIHALVTLHETTSDNRWLKEAERLMKLQIQWYEDADSGGFYTSAHDQDQLFVRLKDAEDSAQPSGNGMTARNLVRLYIITGDASYRTRAEKTIQQAGLMLRSVPQAVPTSLQALNRLLATDAKKP